MENITDIKEQIAIIDLGTHSVRMEIAQFNSNGKIEVLENLSRPLFLGSDVFRTGKISALNIRNAIAILSDFVKLMKEYSVNRYKAVTTSAVREASNKEIFINRIKIACGISFETLEPTEELKLIFQSMKENAGSKMAIKNNNAVICSIGTGSTNIAFIENGHMKDIQTLKFGTLRIIELISGNADPKKIKNNISSFVDTIVDDMSRLAPITKTGLFIAVGETVRTLVSMCSDKQKAKGVISISKKQFNKIFSDISGASPSMLVDKYNISDTMAMGLEPCCYLLDRFFKVINADTLTVPVFNTRDIILKDFLRDILGKKDDFDNEIIASARFIGEKYNYNAHRANVVSEYCVFLFDKLKTLHGLGQRERLMLQCAALLSDTGKFINARQHHKHSFYIIKNTPIPGVSVDEQNIIAAIARYHRKANPSSSHIEYMSLSPDARIIVCKLASILRLSETIEKTRVENDKIKITRDNENLEITIDSTVDLTNIRWFFDNNCSLFMDTYGLKIQVATK